LTSNPSNYVQEANKREDQNDHFYRSKRSLSTDQNDHFLLMKLAKALAAGFIF
jgi:hypothetical protein